jgi:putative phage-type endonuclease
MLENVRELVFNDIFSGERDKIKNNELYKEELIEEINDLIESAKEIFYINIIPPRSYPTTFVRSIPNERKLENLQKQIDYLKSKPQPEQRTPEWYHFRHNLITASNAYKAFENQNVQNQLIYEKCQPLPSFDNKEEGKVEFVNVNTTMHWGQKFEPVSVMIYETEYNTKVGDFGCIQHDKYSFLGASPDGINIDRTKPNRFGRMLEIKNIVNREIDGIPKKEYWIQMQLQMETCDLDECDFLETKFIEYESYDSFLEDGNDFTNTEKGEWKGIIMYFTTKEGRPKYIYKSLTMDKREYENWMEENMEIYKDMLWIKNIYWKIEEISCVLVVRNRKWFQDNIKYLDSLWKIILREREKGYSHRAPAKRIRSFSEDIKTENKIEDYYELGGIKKRTLLEKNGCLINTKGQPQTKTTEMNENKIIRIRTESMDETKKNIGN